MGADYKPKDYFPLQWSSANQPPANAFRYISIAGASAVLGVAELIVPFPMILDHLICEANGLCFNFPTGQDDIHVIEQRHCFRQGKSCFLQLIKSRINQIVACLAQVCFTQIGVDKQTFR